MNRLLTVFLMALGSVALGCDPPPPNANAARPQGSAGGEQSASNNNGNGEARDASVEPPLPEDELAQRGHGLFDVACVRCHRADQSDESLANANLSEAQVDAALHAGSDLGGVMPVVSPSVLREADLPALKAYLRTIHAMR
jgi:mono/diheme cytochrome c family protein